jgi:hypothetical protein
MHDTENLIAPVAKRIPWNKGKLIGRKPPLKQKHVWSIRTKLEINQQTRDLALFNVAIDSKLRGCDVVALKVDDVAPNGYVATLDPWLLTDAANPFVIARRRVACLAGLWVLPSAREDVVATPKERTKQGDLLNIGKCRRTRNARDLRSRRGRCLTHAALLQLLKRSKNARALGIEFGETVLEIRNLLIKGIVHRHAHSRLQDRAEDHSWGSKTITYAYALHDLL